MAVEGRTRGKEALGKRIFRPGVIDIFLLSSSLGRRLSATSLSARATSISEGLPMRKLVLCFANDDTGATAIEYALIAAGISIVIVAAVNSIGTSLNSTFSSISSQLK
jgi:pilus assembly protein Flp/PilA